MKTALVLMSLMVAVAIGAHAQAEARPLPSSVSTSEAAAMIEGGSELLLLDVRTRGEFEQGHLPGAMHIPINEIPRRIDELRPYRDRPILVYCRTDNRSSMARRYLVSQGYSVSFVRGGVVSWSRDRRPLLR